MTKAELAKQIRMQLKVAESARKAGKEWECHMAVSEAEGLVETEWGYGDDGCTYQVFRASRKADKVLIDRVYAAREAWGATFPEAVAPVGY